MRYILLIGFAIMANYSFGQWQLNGNILENQNSGDVVIHSVSNLRTYGRILSYHPKSNGPLSGEIIGTSGYWGFRTDTDNRFHLDVFNSPNSPRSAMSVDQLGNVGIGTGVQTAQLHLTSDNDHALRMTRGNGLYGFRILRNAQQGVIRFQNTDDGNFSGTRIQFDEGGSNWKNVLINPDGGNVGIGTLSPQSKLEVWDNNSNLSILKLRNAAWACNQRTAIEFWNGGNKGYPTSRITSQMDGCGADGEALIFETQTAGEVNPSAKLLIKNNGNVGIGTTNPGQKLTVKGTVYSTEVKVDVVAGTGPDYVFEPTYNLPTLVETEAYIKANKHLPEVPSAKEMETNGINLSEMNMLLLKKVEELTLYLIDHKSELDKLKLENKLLLDRVTNIENR